MAVFFQKKRVKCKIILAKAACFVYKYSTHLTFFAMKNTLLSMFAAALFGTLAASAVDATAVQVSISKGATPKIERMGELPQAGMPAGKPIMSVPAVGWQVVNIPISIKAKSKGDKNAPDFVPSLTVHAYLVVENETLGKPVILDKEITYVDIPVEAKSSGTSTGEAYVGVFISPSNARKLNEKGKGDLKGKLKAVALEATFNGNNCMATDTEPYVVLEPSLKNKLTGKWWKRKSDGGGVTLNSVAETPYAPFIGVYYAATNPRFGSADNAPVASSSAGTGGMDTPAGDISGASSDDSTADGAEDGATDDTMDTGSKKGKKDKKSRRSR